MIWKAICSEMQAQLLKLALLFLINYLWYYYNTPSIDMRCMAPMKRQQPFSVLDQHHTCWWISKAVCLCFFFVFVFTKPFSLGNDSVSLKWNPGLVSMCVVAIVYLVQQTNCLLLQLQLHILHLWLLCKTYYVCQPPCSVPLCDPI